ncbi:polyprenyl synthetase family protein [Actinomadura sp. CNU-125]|uniref:polyprenyl synthetase family protein n=1 Tax=Actinomadura sp. CNU-125 TaxID=1904961 RepID=UPI0021CCAF55|nr:polyprenyl synthetase family protein [Actinomadura sp. CNU-125]
MRARRRARRRRSRARKAAARRAELLGSFGERVGLAFQLADDLLGIWGDPDVTGKPVHSDLRNRKQSLPVVAALESGTPAGGELAEIYRRDAPLADATPPARRARRARARASGRPAKPTPSARPRSPTWTRPTPPRPRRPNSAPWRTCSPTATTDASSARRSGDAASAASPRRGQPLISVHARVHRSYGTHSSPRSSPHCSTGVRQNAMRS